jgi:hypothetical protein
MKIREVYQQLTDTYDDWSKSKSRLTNRQFIWKDSSITWDKREPCTLSKQVMASDISELASKGQYTFQVFIDGSIFQLYYHYDKKGNTLQSARLAFYMGKTDFPVLSTSSAMQDPPDSGDGPISWLRIDYEPALTKGILHHDCHMHLSGFPDARYVIAGVPNPRQFVEFVMATCYRDVYKDHRALDEDGQYTDLSKITSVNSKYFFTVEKPVYKQIMHLRVPGSWPQSL